eukprot:6180858-Pleurochrysis_carterae.AAC.2
MRFDLTANAPVYVLGVPWKVIWHLKRIAEIIVTARETDFQVSRVCPSRNCNQSKLATYVLISTDKRYNCSYARSGAAEHGNPACLVANGT